MTFDDCLRKGLISRAKPDEHRVKGEFEVFAKFLKKAGGLLEPDYYDVSFLLSYTSMFHSARALVYMNGFTERSHACLALFLLEKYRENAAIYDLANALDSYRRTRHLIQYSGEGCSEADAIQALLDAGKLLEAARVEAVRLESDT